MEIEEADVICSLEDLDDLRLTAFFALRKTNMIDGQPTVDELACMDCLQARKDLN